MTAAASARSGPTRTFLSFRLGGETFALDVHHVVEVLDPLPTTRVPRASALVPSLVNVRGSVVPVMSLARRLGLEREGESAEARMIVVETEIGGERCTLAVTAESVDQVLEIAPGEVEPVPEIGIGWPTECLSGVARRNGDLIIFLNPDIVFEPPRDGAAPPREVSPC